RDQHQKMPKIFGLLGAAISNSLYTLFRADLMKLYALCAVTKSHFNLMVMPQDFHGETSSAAFDPAELTRMFWLGYQMAAGAGEWLTTPPDTLPGEASPPRTGLEFLTPK
ncbi:MAG TPA: hypothetical protein VG122_24775, partial [Gemmata sp.]|nr:hypothetical protein [Gemmata sp.]